MDPLPGGPDWMKISPVAGSLFHEKEHWKGWPLDGRPSGPTSCARLLTTFSCGEFGNGSAVVAVADCSLAAFGFGCPGCGPDVAFSFGVPVGSPANGVCPVPDEVVEGCNDSASGADGEEGGVGVAEKSEEDSDDSPPAFCLRLAT